MYISDSSSIHTDYVYLFDGNTTEAPYVTIFSGSYTTLPPGFVSSQQYLLVRLMTDNNTVYKGFRMTYNTTTGW